MVNYWNAEISASAGDSALIDVYDWMTRAAFDSIGIAGFSHDFGTLDGRPSAVADAFNELMRASEGRGGATRLLPLFMQAVPLLLWLPGAAAQRRKRLLSTMGEIATQLLARCMEESQAGGVIYNTDKSLIGALSECPNIGHGSLLNGLAVKAEKTDSGYSMTHDEILAQMNVLLIAGYVTTSSKSSTFSIYDEGLNYG